MKTLLMIGIIVAVAAVFIIRQKKAKVEIEFEVGDETGAVETPVER